MILVVNAGSSSVKVAVFEGEREVARGEVTEVGGEGRLRLGAWEQPVAAAGHEAALGLLLASLRGEDLGPERLEAAAHRVVHGGAALTAPARLTAETVAAIEACVPLAPLHNPANLAGIRALGRLAPGLPQFASFDTAFHATLPEVEFAYALPRAWAARGLRRYGFHGISYAGLVEGLRERGALPRRLLAFHLGNGASACAILGGASVATSMGYSPLDGLVMGTRAGSIDGMAVLELARAEGIEAAGRVLNRESGLKGLAGTSDMRALLSRDDAEARFAVGSFCHWAVRHGAGLAGAMGGVDALAFTGGIGEHAAPVRERIVEGLAFLGAAAVHVVPAREEAGIARDARRLLAAEGGADGPIRAQE